MSHKPRREDYTVGWVCALPVELVAARLMLDKRYDAPDLEAGENWDDTYHMGSIAGHNVVIACLPFHTGISSAAALATRMQAKFRGIRLRLMVGIGGGVPSGKADIRLGDVVVSVPKHIFGGVVQYDMGKTTPTDVTRTGSLAPPPHELLSAAVALQSDIMMGESKLLSILSTTERIPCLRRCKSSDVLYEADYDHKDGPTCEKCHSNKQVVRPQRVEGQEVLVHHGTIASGSQLIKSAVARDEISRKLGGVLCFEMEAAGLMNDFRCIVIRGISDYADSHKNDDWQGYAASTAAAYAKELLQRILPTQVIRVPKANENSGDTGKRRLQSTEANSASSKRRKTQQADDQVLHFEGTTLVLQDRTRKPVGQDRTSQQQQCHQSRQLLSEEQKEQLLMSLTFDQIHSRQETIKRAHNETCKWLLKNASYLEWLDVTKINNHHGFLWIKGNAGTGKSTLMKFALQTTCEKAKDQLVLSFFFNARGSMMEKSTIGAYRSLLLQLLKANPELYNVFSSLYSSTSNFDKDYDWSLGSLETLLEQAIRMLENTSIVCFIDALDECDEKQIRDMFRFFEHIRDLAAKKNTRFFVCFASRYYPNISLDYGLELRLEGQEGHYQDIANYISAELKIRKSKQAQEIRSTIQEKAAGIFMWVVLVVEMLNTQWDGGHVDRLKQTLREIPSDLHNLFGDMLIRDSKDKEELISCIQWVLFAKQPLSPEQLYYAIMSSTKPGLLSAWDPEAVDQAAIERFILNSSKGLINLTGSSKSKNRKAQFIHESVRDCLLEEDRISSIWPEYKDNFHGKSHEKLKQSSLGYLTSDLERLIELPESLPKANSSEAKALRLLAQQRFPFLELAVRNIFYHADQAEHHGVSQMVFIRDFQLVRWTKLYNMFEKFQTRRYWKNVSLFYVLAEEDCASLIRSHLPLKKGLLMDRGRYGCPLIAACALGHEAVIQLFSSDIESSSAIGDSNHKQAKCDPDGTSARQFDFTYLRKRSVLFNAASICPEWLMIRLLESSTCIHSTPSSDIKAILEEACRRNHSAVVEKLLHDHTFLSDGQCSPRDRGLLIAVKERNESLAKMLVLKNANIEVQDSITGNNPIHLASIRGLESMAVFLLDKRPDLINSRNKAKSTPLILATAHKHISLAEVLLSRGADIRLESETYGDVLYQASENGFKDFVLRLLESGAQLTQQQGHKHNTLEGACLGGKKDIIELLLGRGAQINTEGAYWGSALQAACSRNRLHIVELLLQRGAKINAQCGYHGNALQMACSGRRRDIVELLLEKGADINAKGGTYGNALLAACAEGDKDIVELLLKRGADVNARGGFWRTALRAAHNSDVRQLLRKYGARE